MKVVVGLGNPGTKYAKTRHNVGFETIDLLAQSPNAGGFRTAFQAEIAELQEDDEKILLVKPQTFMNLSGRCVRQILDFYQLPMEALLVVTDDVNLPLGKLRARAKGTHGGHNGLRDIQNHLGTTEYCRLRIGVDAPGHDMVNHVLSRFKAGERAIIEDAMQLASVAVGVWIHQGIEECMNQFNSTKKNKES